MAGPSKKEVEEIKRILEQIKKLYGELGESNPFEGVNPKNIAASAEETKKLKESLQDARDAVADMDGEAGDLFKSWRAITDEVKGYRRTINDSKATVSKINDLSQKLKDHQSKTSTLSVKELSSLKSKLEQQKSILKSNRDSLKSAIEELKAKKSTGNISARELSQLRESENIYHNITQGLNENDGLLKDIIDKTETELDLRKQIEGKLGVTGGLLKGMSQIPFIKDSVDTEKILSSANDEIELTGSGVKGLKAGFKEMGSQIKSGLLNPANLVTLAITQLTQALVSSDEATGELAKSMNLTYSGALNVRRELGSIAAESMDVAVNTKGLQETLVAVGSQLGSNAKLNKEDLVTFTKLREQAGYTNEELYGIQQLSLVNGKSLEANTKEILGGARAYASRNKLVINEKQVLKDVSKASASLKLTLGGSAEAVAEAATKARQFGLNLEQAEKISQSLLDFESSIENELSAELLTGKDLNFERARALALNGDTAAAAEEIAKQVGTSADFTKMNVIQQEAMAKAAGMTRDELAQSLMDREALAKLSGVEGANAQERFNNLVKEVGMEEAKKRLGNDQLASQYEQQSVQERFAQATEKLQELFIQLAEPILAIVSPLMNLVSTVLPAINFLLQPIMGAFQAISGVITGNFEGLSKTQVVLGGIVAALTGAYAVFKGIAAIQGIINTLKEKDLALEGRKKAVQAASFLKSQAGAVVEIVKGAWSSLGPIPFVGAALAAAAIAGGIAYLYSQSSKGNDIVSPAPGGSGYGKRTLFGPEGAIQLNDKDTIVAGTDLFSKTDDMISAPKGAISMAKNQSTSPKGPVSVSNKTAPKKEAPIDPNAGTNARLDALIAMTGKVNSVSTLKIQ